MVVGRGGGWGMGDGERRRGGEEETEVRLNSDYPLPFCLLPFPL
jgi:hypothetical protein